MRDEPRHRHAYGQGHWVGIGAATGVIAAVALAGLGVWGTATLAARSTDGVATPTVTATHRATAMPSAGGHGPWLPAARHGRAALDVTGTPHPATAVQHGVTTTTTSTTTTTPVHSACAECTTVFSVTLPHDAHLDGVQWRNGDTSAQGWLDYYVADRLVARSGLSEDTPQPGDADHPVAAACVPAGRVARCAVSYDTGAHTSAVLLLVAGPASGIHITDRVEDSAAGAWLTDLNGDGLPDASVVESTLRPDYAHAPRFWHTYLQRGGKLVSTGCSAPATAPGPRPDHPETGPCLH